MLTCHAKIYARSLAPLQDSPSVKLVRSCLLDGGSSAELADKSDRLTVRQSARSYLFFARLAAYLLRRRRFTEEEKSART